MHINKVILHCIYLPFKTIYPNRKISHNMKQNYGTTSKESSHCGYREKIKNNGRENGIVLFYFFG